MSDFSWLYIEGRQKLCQDLNARFVGGCVRNSLLHYPIDDFDLATPLLPEMVMDILKKQGFHVLPTGLAHGTVTALTPHGSYEITTLRRDVVCDGRWSTIEPTDSWEEDAKRRDFTINALYLDAQGTLYDYCEGLQDIKAHRLRFIGDPYARIQEDFLRILRFFRFWAVYADHVDPLSCQAAVELSPHLLTLSRERITKEWLKLLEAPQCFDVVTFLAQEKVLPFILGEGKISKHMAIFPLVDKMLGPLPALERLSIFWEGDCSRLCLSRDQASFLEFLRKKILFYPHAVIESLYTYGKKKTKALLLQWFLRQGSLKMDQKRKKFLQVSAIIDADSMPSFPVSGKDLIAQGMQPGYAMGKKLERARAWWIASHRLPDKQACLHFINLLIINAKGKKNDGGE